MQGMPALARVAAEYEDSVGFIALLLDYDTNLEGALRIVESAGVPQSFVMVYSGTEGLEGLLQLVSSGYLPTTVIIDGDGRPLTQQIVGSLGDGYAEVLDYLLE